MRTDMRESQKDRNQLDRACFGCCSTTCEGAFGSWLMHPWVCEKRGAQTAMPMTPHEARNA